MLKKMLKSCDLFATKQFLRYKNEGQNGSISGAVCSILIVVIVTFLFFSAGLQIMNKSNIKWNINTLSQNDPSETLLSRQNNNFAFNIGILELDLVNPQIRYFDIWVKQTVYGVGNTLISSTDIPLENCKLQHFIDIGEGKQRKFNNYGSKRLCTSMNQTFELQGGKNSQIYKKIQIFLRKCNPTLENSRPCANQQTIANLENSYGGFSLSISFINPLINAGEHEYLNFYEQENNFMRFSSDFGQTGQIEVQDFNIETDSSLLPYEETFLEEGVKIPERMIKDYLKPSNGLYSHIKIIKSSKVTTYTRSFNKIDTFFSYIGGLIGAVISAMFIVNNFSEMSFEMKIAKDIMKFDENEDNISSFNMFQYCKYFFYCVATKIGLFKSWKKMKRLKQFNKFVKKQIDISLILKRILLLESGMKKMLKKYQIQGLISRKKQTLQQVKERYKSQKQIQYLKNQIFSDDSSSQEQQSGQQRQKYLIEDQLKIQESSSSLSMKKTQISSFYKIKKKKKYEDQNLNFLDLLLNDKGNKINQDILNEIDQSVKEALSKKNENKIEQKKDGLDQEIKTKFEIQNVDKKIRIKKQRR